MKRRLKIEEQHQDNGRADYLRRSRRVPAVRLKGKWLQAAGFPPGQHLELTVISPGVIELRVIGMRPAQSPELAAIGSRMDEHLDRAARLAP